MLKSRWVQVIVVVILLACLVGGVNLLSCDKTAEAGGGTTEVTCSVPASGYDGYSSGTSGAMSWADKCNSNAGSITVTGDMQGVYWSTSGTTNTWNIQRNIIIGFDVSTVPLDSNITSMKLRLKCSALVNEAPETWTEGYIGLYVGKPVEIPMVAGDHDNAIDAGSLLVSDLVYVSEMVVGVWDEWEVMLPDYYFDTYMEDGKLYFYIMHTNAAYLASPTWVAGGNVDYSQNWNSQDTAGTESDPQLVIQYTDSIPPRAIADHVNDVVDDDTTGTEVVTDLAWTTPRAVYGDLDMEVLVEGDSGAVCQLQLMDSNDKVLLTKNDSVRVDGYFYWKFSPGATRGYVRVKEVTSGLLTKWAVVADAPSGTQMENSIQVLDTVYPQYNTEFADFTVKRGTEFQVHWKTAIEDTELADFEVAIENKGRQGDILWSETLATMADDYYEGSEDNQALLGWCYAVFTMDGSQQGYDDRDGLIIDLQTLYSDTTAGFYVPMIIQDTVTECVTANSAAWYLPAKEGVSFGLNKTRYAVNEAIQAQVIAGELSNVSTHLSRVIVAVYTTAGNEISSVGGMVEGTQADVSVPGIIAEGNYYVRLSLWSEDSSFIYQYQQAITIGAGSSTSGTGSVSFFGMSMWDKVKDTLAQFGLDNQMGYWFVIILMMGVGFFFFRKSAMLRVVVPLLFLGIGIIGSWVQSWLVILLALGAGVVIYGLTKKAFGGGHGGGDKND